MEEGFTFLFKQGGGIEIMLETILRKVLYLRSENGHNIFWSMFQKAGNTITFKPRH